jgi:hypothetical protein
MKQMGSLCDENVVFPIATMFYNGHSTVDIITRKRKLKIERVLMLKQFEILKQLPWYKVGSRFFQSCSLRWTRLKSEFLHSRYLPNADAVEDCLSQPEFDFLKYLHKLTERMANWSSFSHKDRDYYDLPQEFRSVLGAVDPPHAEYSHLFELQQFADHYLTQKMQRTLFIVMLSEKLNIARQVEPSHRA